jgi:hypothetical protein
MEKNFDPKTDLSIYFLSKISKKHLNQLDKLIYYLKKSKKPSEKLK